VTTSVNGAAIRAIRERSGLSVRDVVAALKTDCGIAVHEDHVRNVETGAKGASPRLAAGLAKVLRVPTPAILAAPATEPESTVSEPEVTAS
jgi:transcriptional regulator with XRE-family HTH domain